MGHLRVIKSPKEKRMSKTTKKALKNLAGWLFSAIIFIILWILIFYWKTEAVELEKARDLVFSNYSFFFAFFGTLTGFLIEFFWQDEKRLETELLIAGGLILMAALVETVQCNLKPCLLCIDVLFFYIMTRLIIKTSINTKL